MKYTTSWLLASVGLAAAFSQQCSSGKVVNEGGNAYCDAVNQILYTGFAGNGSFKAVTAMSPTGECRQEDQSYEGPLAPLDQGLSVHFRGPLQLKQFAVHIPASTKKCAQVDPAVSVGDTDTDSRVEQGELKAGVEAPRVSARHAHGRRCLYRAHRAKQANIASATVNTDTKTWSNNFVKTHKPVSPPVHAIPGIGAAAAAAGAGATTSRKPSEEMVNKKPASSASCWQRVAYYHAEKQVSENIVFMGNHGGQGSGVFDTVWGLSLAYLNSKGNGGASSPQILQDIRIPSNQEFSIYSAEKCDSSCGFSRVPEVAYKGFRGANKIFLFEFKMPLDGTRCPQGARPGSPGCANPDMPAIWLLHEAISRTGQYHHCSCWTSKCGEVDVFEILAPGDDKCKSTFHIKNGGGSSDYFVRPVDEFIKVALIFHEETASVSIKKLPYDVDFSESLSDETVLSWLSRPTDDNALDTSSLFRLVN